MNAGHVEVAQHDSSGQGSCLTGLHLGRTRHIPTSSLMGKMKEMRPLTQPVRVMHESNALKTETCMKCVGVLKEEHLILPLGTGAVR